jgi:hypothetical protein
MTHAQTDAMTRRAIAMNGAIKPQQREPACVLMRFDHVAR